MKITEISKLDAEDLLDFSTKLGGEEAIEELIRFVDYPNDAESGNETVKAVVSFILM